MSWFGRRSGGAAPDDAAGDARRAEWSAALDAGRLPGFVEQRLEAAAAGKAPWLATMTPAELALARTKGIRPLATVSGTCWYHYGWSWTNGHAEGWHAALGRLRLEALAVGANAVIDVRLRTVRLPLGESMDFTVLGTAVRIDGLGPSKEPVVATVAALEFVRLLEAGIIPVGLAIGAHYEWLSPATTIGALRLERPGTPFANAPLRELGGFWESVRRQALADLHRDTERLGGGVLAHTHFGQLLKREGDNNQPPRFLGRHIIIGTVVDAPRSGANRSHEIRTVVDMRDTLSPLRGGAGRRTTYPVGDEEGAI